MPLSNAAMVVGANAVRSALRGIQLHTDTPGEGGVANKSNAAMQVPTWTAVTGDGDFGLAAAVGFTGATPNGPVKWVSLWSSTTTGKIWYGNFQLSGDLTADANGNYTLETLDLNGSSS